MAMDQIGKKWDKTAQRQGVENGAQLVRMKEQVIKWRDFLFNPSFVALDFRVGRKMWM